MDNIGDVEAVSVPLLIARCDSERKRRQVVRAGKETKFFRRRIRTTLKMYSLMPTHFCAHAPNAHLAVCRNKDALLVGQQNTLSTDEIDALCAQDRAIC